jgi:DNA-binding SARP family transcriptional activator
MASAAARVELRVLGPLELVVDGWSAPLTAEKQRLLLAALVVRAGEALPSDVLVEALWQGAPPASARKALQVYVSQLRKLLPAGLSIETHGSGYSLVLDGTLFDAQRFERLCAEGREALGGGNAALARSRFARALSLWRGPAYGELAYADVARAEAERLDELRVAAQAGLLEAELELGLGDPVGAARALVAENPHDEGLAGLAMLALYRAGRQTEALEEYAAARDRLDELGLEPGPGLRELQRAILVHDPSLQTGARPPFGVLLAAGRDSWNGPHADR